MSLFSFNIKKVILFLSLFAINATTAYLDTAAAAAAAAAEAEAVASVTGLTGIKYEGYYADNYTFFDTAIQQADVRFDNVVFSAINTTTPGQNFDDSYSVRFYGYFTATVTGTHTFYTASDDASMLWLGASGETVSALETSRTTGNAIVNNSGAHGVVEQSGTVSLVAGNSYPILVYFGEDGGGDSITVSFAAPGIAKTNDGSGHYSSIAPDSTAPSGSLAYSVGGNTASSVSANDVVTITATFNENIADSPVMQISGSGVETISATNMTKVNANSYTYTWTMGTGAGAQTFALATGTDIVGNVVTATPTSGATILIDAPQHLTKYGEISIGSADLVNKYGALGETSGLTANGKRISISTAPDGLTSATASTSAYQIKQDFPGSTDGLYWIANSNINSGTPFQIYADMTTDGGGWTLIITNAASSGWTYANAIERNTGTPSITTSYSIIAWADYIKRSASGFQYMIDAGTRGTHGAIWTANGSYSFVNSNNTQTNVTINTKFGTWNYHDQSIEQRMPWYSNSQGLITTSIDPNGSWWGTLISSHVYYSPAPYMHSDCGDSCLQNPGIIWYWVR